MEVPFGCPLSIGAFELLKLLGNSRQVRIWAEQLFTLLYLLSTGLSVSSKEPRIPCILMEAREVTKT